MSTNALAFLLLTQYREGASIEHLVNALDNLRKDLEYARRDIGFTGDSIDVINYAVSMKIVKIIIMSVNLYTPKLPPLTRRMAQNFLLISTPAAEMKSYA